MQHCYTVPEVGWLRLRRSHWNAEVSTKNFWWMYIKAAARGTMSKCGCLTLGWTPGAGGKKVANCWTKSCEAKNDLLPHCLFAVSPGHHQHTSRGHNTLLDPGLRGQN